MDKFKKNLAEGKTVTISEVFGDEPTFTDKFLVEIPQFSKIMIAIGRDDEIESVESQVQTSDSKSLDNMAITVDGERIALEAQVGTSDMGHTAKLPYYMDNLRDRDENEVMIGILLAEGFNQEAIDYYSTLNELPYFDLYLVKSVCSRVY